jgi:tetratricopeptide (TPR) repeat protein|tara:strand:- start:5127 stop:6722 length:1596 start_codon:yes stop_codon:yes gene_type:complete
MMSNIKNKQTKEERVLFQKAKEFIHLHKYKQAEEIIATLIQQEMNNAEPFYLMALIKERRGMYTEQIEFLGKALIISPCSSEFLIEIAYAHLKLGHFSESFQYANITRNNKNNSIEICTLLGRIYHELGKYNESVTAYKEAIELSNDDHYLLYSYGTVLTLSGKIKESIEAYQQAIKIAPSFGLAYAALSKARKSTINENNIEKLKLLVIEDRNPWTGINIHHGLAKEYDDLGQYTNAFNVLEKGKKRLRISCPHSPNAGAKNIRKLTALYKKQANEINSNRAGSTIAPIFVTGMPRTGTTIVERILTNTPKVMAIGERIQFSTLLKQQCMKNYTGLVDAQVLEEIWPSIDFDKLGHDYIKSVQYLTNDYPRFVDKLPLNILLAGAILRALPKAKIICLMRDPLDTIIGNYRQVFEQQSGTYAYTLELNAIASFVYEFRELATNLQLLFGERFMIVNYETLVDEPLVQANKIYEFCELSWDDTFIDIHKNTATIGTASAAQVQEPIHKKSLAHSRNYLFCLEKFKVAFQHQ